MFSMILTKCEMTYIHHYNFIQISNLSIHHPFLLAVPGNYWSFYYLQNFRKILSFPKCHIIWIIFIALHILITFSYWLILHSNRHLRFLHVFLCVLKADFLLGFSNISLPGCTRIYTFTHWRTSYVFQVWEILNKSLWTSYTGFCSKVESFQIFWVNIKEHNNWIIWSKFI